MFYRNDRLAWDRQARRQPVGPSRSEPGCPCPTPTRLVQPWPACPARPRPVPVARRTEAQGWASVSGSGRPASRWVGRLGPKAASVERARARTRCLTARRAGRLVGGVHDVMLDGWLAPAEAFATWAAAVSH